MNVVDQETLRKACEKPEDYGDLLIRVGGFTEYWRNLSPTCAKASWSGRSIERRAAKTAVRLNATRAAFGFARAQRRTFFQPALDNRGVILYDTWLGRFGSFCVREELLP